MVVGCRLPCKPHRVDWLAMTQQDITHFTTVDHTADPGFFLHFLDQANRLLAGSGWKPAILRTRKLPAGSHYRFAIE
jgi:hypothetical protein